MIVEPKIYIDSNSIIDVLKYNQFQTQPKLAGVKLEDQPYYIHDFQYKKQHIEYCNKLLKAAEYKDLTLLTSTVSVAEVWRLAGSKRKPQPPSKEDKRIIDSVLTSGQIIKLISDSYFVAVKARDLMWKYGLALTGLDAIQVASALQAECLELITYDNAILACKDKMKRLGLNIIHAQDTSGLPASFSQPLLDRASEFNTDEILLSAEFIDSEDEGQNE